MKHPADKKPPRREGFWARLLRGVRRTEVRSDWPGFAGQDWIERIMQMGVTDDFHAKQGRSTGRLVLEEKGKRLTVYLKRHYQLPWWQGLLAALWPGGGWSPAWQEWKHLSWAREQGIPAPAQVAAGEYIGPWGRLQSFLAIEELPDMAPLHEAIPVAAQQLDAVTFQRWKRGLVRELARLTGELHQRKAFHKDLYLCHFFIPRADLVKAPDEWRGRVHVIDLHRLGRHPLTWLVWQLKDLGQLLYSSEVAGLTARDRLRFWRYYQGPNRRSLWNRLMARFIRFKGRRYRSHNAKKIAA